MSRFPLSRSFPQARLTIFAVAAFLACADRSLVEPRITPPGEEVAAKGGDQGPTVKATDPDSATVDTTINVRVIGRGFDAGSRADWAFKGVVSEKIVTNSTVFVSSTELIANITIARNANIGSHDVIVTTATGKPGIGTELFVVTTEITIVDLGGISEDGASYARDVNASGVIVGWANTRKYEPDSYAHAMRWTVSDAGVLVKDDLMAAMGLPAIADALARGVNNVGTIVGDMRSSDNENYHGFVLSALGVVNVSTFPRCDGATEERNYSSATDINNNQEVIGHTGYKGTSGKSGYAFYLDLRAASPCLAPLPGLSISGAAYAINDSSVIVGESSESAVNWAVRWRKAEGVWSVSKLGRDSTRAWGINLRGDVAGQFLGPISFSDQHALLWRSSVDVLSEHEIGALGGELSNANAVDSTGRVVGWAHNKPLNPVAFDWTESTGMRDLGLPLGGKSASAYAVNGKRIVGYSSVAGPGRTITDHATLWRLP